MSGEASKTIDNTTLWGGGRSPFSVSYGKMMMWFFLISDALTFGALLSSLGFMRHKFADTWPVSEEIFFHFPFTHTHLPLMYVALMTFILIVSSVTMVLAVEAGHRMNRKKVTMWLALTVVGGLFFVCSQAWEWSSFIAGPDGIISTWGDNATLAQNPYPGKNGGPGAVHYTQFFFFVTGFHGTHVLSGVVLNFIILLNVLKGKYEKVGHYEMVEKVGLYWHFIDLVWVFVFTFYYLL
jgi:cytochrome c oxidase subunit III|tara:strand:+ start:2477 stop:3190 length:714 start_codon:yes stop_codon:yes gene_type:complete